MLNLSQFGLRAENDISLVDSLKPLGELALTAFVVQKYATGRSWHRISGQCVDAVDFCWSQLGRGTVLVDVIERYPDLLVLASIYPALTHFGYRCLKFERAVESSTLIRGVYSLEYPAWRALDIDVALRALGMRSPWETASLFEQTWLAKMPEPWSLCESSAYSLTHTVFYMTHFGENKDGIPGPHRDYLTRWVPVWQRYYARCENMDLLAEMTMVMRCIDRAEDGVDVAAVFMNAQATDGIIPGPDGAAFRMVAKADSEQRVRFLQNYHTTLVALMASVMCAGATDD